MTESFESLRTLLSDAGYAFIEPPIVHDARVFVELAGEDLRRRLFLTNAADGSEMALRPDYTIPVCLAHLKNGAPPRRADYAYLGPVFRQRGDGPGEFLQAGIESIGRNDRAAADADVLALAIAATELLGISEASVRIGDQALFGAALDALGLDGPWRRRLARTFGDQARLTALIARATNGTKHEPGMDRRSARRKAQALLSASGLGTTSGRTAEEIAERMVEKAALAAGIGVKARKTLESLLSIHGPPASAIRALRRLARRDGFDISAAVDRFERRVEAFVRRGIDPDRLAFAADFGRRLDYYTGFVFEIHDPARADGRQIVGGGRYDRLLSLISRWAGATPGQAIPAIGFAIWLDRIEAGS